MIFLLFIINNCIFCMKGFLEGMECFMCSKGDTNTSSTKGENISFAANKILRSLQIQWLYPCWGKKLTKQLNQFHNVWLIKPKHFS